MTERKSLLKEFMLPAAHSLVDAQKLLVSDDSAVFTLYLSSKDIAYVRPTTDPNVLLIRYNNLGEKYVPITMAKFTELMRRTGCAVVGMEELRRDAPMAQKRLTHMKPVI